MNSIYRLMYSGGLMLAIFFLVLTIFLFFWLKIPKVFDELTGRSERRGIRSIREHDDFAGAMSKRERDKYYARGTEKIRVKKSSYSYTGSTGFLDKSKKDKTSSKLKRKKENTDTLLEEQSDELKFSQSGTLKGKDENVDFVADSSDPETGLLCSDANGEEIVGVEKKEYKNTSEDETAVLLEKEENVDAEEATSVLLKDDASETAEDGDEATSVLADGEDETSVLSDEEQTSVLAEEEATSVLVETDVIQNESEEKVEPKEILKDKKIDGIKVIYDIVIVHSKESI